MTVFQDVTSFALAHVCQDNGVLGYEAVYVFKQIPKFRGNILPLFSG